MMNGGVPVPSPGGGANLGALLSRGAKARGGAASSGAEASEPALSPALAAAGVNAQAKAEELSPEAQVIMIEANRLATQELVDQGKLPPLPPTALTPTDATAHNGSPLIVPNDNVPVKPK
jgi:hypothetical protein